jgi:fatty-acyl-CoA synthase
MTERVARLAHALRDIGVQGGARVAYLGSNHPAFLESLFATATLGAVFVPLNARLSAAEIDFMLADSGASVLIFGNGSASTVTNLDGATRPLLVAVDGGTRGSARLCRADRRRTGRARRRARRSRRALP